IKCPRLRELQLNGCTLGNEDIAVLSRSSLFDQLRLLALVRNRIGEKGVAEIAKSESRATLQALYLWDNCLGKGALERIVRPGAFPALISLSLPAQGHTKLSPRDIAPILAKLAMSNLRSLNLSGWPIGDVGAKALAANPALTNLWYLGVSNAQIG